MVNTPLRSQSRQLPDVRSIQSSQPDLLSTQSNLLSIQSNLLSMQAQIGKSLGGGGQKGAVQLGRNTEIQSRNTRNTPKYRSRSSGSF